MRCSEHEHPGDPQSDLEQLIYDQLGRQLPYKREAVLALVVDYRLDPRRLDRDERENG